jgi:hypothetical protein
VIGGGLSPVAGRYREWPATQFGISDVDVPGDEDCERALGTPRSLDAGAARPRELAAIEQAQEVRQLAHSVPVCSLQQR